MLFSINTKPRDCYLLPDLVIADIDHEHIEGRNPLQNALKKHMRAELKDALIENLTDEQKFVLRKTENIFQQQNPYLKKG